MIEEPYDGYGFTDEQNEVIDTILDARIKGVNSGMDSLEEMSFINHEQKRRFIAHYKDALLKHRERLNELLYSDMKWIGSRTPTEAIGADSCLCRLVNVDGDDNE